MSLIENYSHDIAPNGHFTWMEYAYLPRINALGIPTAEQYKNAVFLFAKIRDIIRLPLGKPLIVSSGCRNMEYTLLLRRHGISAALQSAHMEWKAVDLKPPAGMTNEKFWHWCDKVWPGRMENLQFTPNWIHLDTRNWGSGNRFNP